MISKRGKKPTTKKIDECDAPTSEAIFFLPSILKIFSFDGQLLVRDVPLFIILIAYDGIFEGLHSGAFRNESARI